MMGQVPALYFVLALLVEVGGIVCTSGFQSIVLGWKVLAEKLGYFIQRSGEPLSGLHYNGEGGPSASEDHLHPFGGDKEPVHIRSYELYEGTVVHSRSKPVKHQFKYKVRFAVINMDAPPDWFEASSSKHHLSADEARRIASSDGAVYLLTNPVSVGYEQNPISVYYCYNNNRAEGEDVAGPPGPLHRCIAEVTNTPWGERVVFLFGPDDDIVPKPLHVSPFMDMDSTWHIHLVPPGDRLSLAFSLDHPSLGRYFTATLRAQRMRTSVDVPEAFLWLSPHKVAVGIYWQAFLLWWKGVPLFTHPKYETEDAYKYSTVERDGKKVRRHGATCPVIACVNGKDKMTIGGGLPGESGGKDVMGGRFMWRNASYWPWNL